MTEREPNLVTSSLSGPVTRDDVTVEAEFLRTVTEEGMLAFLDNGNVIPFRH